MIQYAVTSSVQSNAGDYWMPAFAGMTVSRLAQPLYARTRLSICSTCAIGVSGWMPWPRLKISRPLRVIRQHVVDRAVERRAAGDQRQRIEIALHGDAVCTRSRISDGSAAQSMLTALTPVAST